VSRNRQGRGAPIVRDGAIYDNGGRCDGSEARDRAEAGAHERNSPGEVSSKARV
jgi:hypothetical protein